MRNTRTYTDIDLNFKPLPNVLGIPGTRMDIGRKFDEDAIKASIRNLILTSNYERPFHSDIGSRIKHLIFEPITPMLNGVIKQEINNLISAYEPRAILLDVITTYKHDINTVDIAIVFKMNGTSLISTATVSLERTR